MAKKPPYVRAIGLTDLPEFIEKLGGNSNDLFTQVGLDPKVINQDNAIIAWPKACHLLELCAKTLEEPHFGIKWAHELSEDLPNIGPMIFAAALVPTAREFIQIFLRYEKTHGNAMATELIEDEAMQQATYLTHLHPRTPACRQYMEHIAAVIYRMANQFMHNAKFQEIHFQHSPLTDLSFYEKEFDCRVIFNSNHFKITGDLSNLDKPLNGPLANSRLNGSLSFLQPLLKKYLDRRLKNVIISETPISDTIEEILPAIFGTGKIDIDSVATTLGVSTKKMQRLLKTESTSFSIIRDQTRQKMTERIFRESDIKISTLARLLDYNSSEAFNTACQRWVGQSPRAYRAALKSGKL